MATSQCSDTCTHKKTQTSSILCNAPAICRTADRRARLCAYELFNTCSHNKLFYAQKQVQWRLTYTTVGMRNMCGQHRRHGGPRHWKINSSVNQSFNNFFRVAWVLQIYTAIYRWSGRFVKQEQWERWRAKQKLVSGSKHRGHQCGFRGITPQKEKNWDCISEIL